MQVQKKMASQCILTGIPGSLFWMLLLNFVGLFLVTASLAVGWKWGQEQGLQHPWILSTLGSICGVFSILTGVMQLRAREGLLLDKTTRTGIYSITSPILMGTTHFKFAWEQVECVELAKSSEALDKGTEKTRETTKALLKIKNPRKVIILETSNTTVIKHVQSVAQTVADFLEIRVQQVKV